MSLFAVIVENDESQWSDVKGQAYHFPSRYLKHLQQGCKILYYKGKLRKLEFSAFRLSDEPNYFGIAEIGESVRESSSDGKHSYFCENLNYQEFEQPIPIKVEGKYLEPIPESRQINYWRDGVRAISQEAFRKISELAILKNVLTVLPSISGEFESTDLVEGQSRKRYTTYYECNPVYRRKAIEIHGCACIVCDFSFEKVCGALGRGFIHVHHNKPISEVSPTVINPVADMSVLCPNYHAMIHRKQQKTLSLEELTLATKLPGRQ